MSRNASLFDGDADNDIKDIENLFSVHSEEFHYVSSVPSELRAAASALDPNNGRCLLTLQSNPVDAYHLIPRDLTSDKLANFEWWWGVDNGKRVVDDSHNVIFLHPNVHYMIDNGYWVLVPDLSFITSLFEVVPSRGEPLKAPIENSYTTKTFKYRVVPLLPTHDIQITHIAEDADDDLLKFSSHEYPYTTLGTLESHVYPHYVLFKTGEKMARLKLDLFTYHKWLPIFAQCMGIQSDVFAQGYAAEVVILYNIWSQPPPWQRSSNYSDQLSWGNESAGSWSGGNARSVRSLKPSVAESGRDGQFDGQFYPSGRITRSPRMDSFVNDEDKVDEYIDSDDEDELTHDIAKSREVVSKWWDATSETATQEGWNSFVVNDGEIGPYADERPRSPRLEPWSTWNPTWVRRRTDSVEKPPPDTTKFSSNDWALKDHFIRLPRYVDPEDDIYYQNLVINSTPGAFWF